MASRRLKNYLRAYRKRTGLSQDEIAYLLGCADGGKVSRYERFRREPGFRTALAYEIIFNIPVRELFAGVFDEVEKKTLRRVGLIGRKLHSKGSTRINDRKLEALAEIIRSVRTRSRKP